jgi:cytochrome c-type biogenesis protein CcmH
MSKKLLYSHLFAIAMAVILAGFAEARVAAQDVTPNVPTDDQVNAIAKQMYCPVCENTPLDVCPTQACAEWRELIRDKLAEGWSEAQIRRYFVEQFGDRVLATPPARGLNWLVYVIPPLAILAGAYLLYRAFRAWRQPAPATQVMTANEVQASTGPDDEYVRRLEEELRRL